MVGAIAVYLNVKRCRGSVRWRRDLNGQFEGVFFPCDDFANDRRGIGPAELRWEVSRGRGCWRRDGHAVPSRRNRGAAFASQFVEAIGSSFASNRLAARAAVAVRRENDHRTRHGLTLETHAPANGGRPRRRGRTVAPQMERHRSDPRNHGNDRHQHLNQGTHGDPLDRGNGFPLHSIGRITACGSIRFGHSLSHGVTTLLCVPLWGFVLPRLNAFQYRTQIAEGVGTVADFLLHLGREFAERLPVLG